MFSLTCILTKNDVEFLPIEISTREIILEIVRGNNVVFWNIEITSKKVRENDVDFSISEITLKKVRGNDVEFLISEITSKKYVEMTWKFVEICSSAYRCNIGVESTTNQRGVPVGLTDL